MSFLDKLKAKAVIISKSRGGVPVYELSVEDARARVIVKNGDKNPKEDGSQALVLNFGKVNLNLDFITEGAGRFVVTKGEVEEYTNGLIAEIKAGTFDAAIEEAQVAAKLSAEKAAAKALLAKNPPAAAAAVGEDIDLDAIPEKPLADTATEAPDDLDLDDLG